MTPCCCSTRPARRASPSSSPTPPGASPSTDLDGVISVSEPTFNPVWVGVRPAGSPDGALRRFFDAGTGVTRRQDVERYLRINGNFYLWRSDFVRRLESSWFDEGTHAGAEIPESQAFSIDDEYEFRLIEALIVAGIIRLPWIEGSPHDDARASPTSGAAPRSSPAAPARSGRCCRRRCRRRRPGRRRRPEQPCVLRDRGLAPGRRPLAVAADLLEPQGLSRVVATVQELGACDVLVNNAAFTGTSGVPGYAVPFDEQTDEAFAMALALNLTAPFSLTRQLAPLLRAEGHGSVINVSSIYGLVGPNMGLYEGTRMGNPAATPPAKAVSPS